MNSIRNAVPNVNVTARSPRNRLAQAALVFAAVLFGAVGCADGGVTEPLAPFSPVAGLQAEYDSVASPEEKYGTPPAASAGASLAPLMSVSSSAGSLNRAASIAFAPERGPFANQLPGCDDCTFGSFAIGFPFNYYGTVYNSFWISSNGFVSLSRPSTNGCCGGKAIPLPDSPNNMIALAWVDLFPKPGQMAFETRGEAPRRRLIVNYDRVQAVGEGTRTVTVQLILHEGTNEIEIHTSNLPLLPTDPRHTVTQGAENATGTEAIFVQGRTATKFALTNDAVRFSGAQVNAVPVALPGGNAGTAPNKFYEGVEGTAVQFQGSGVDLDNDNLTYSWDFNNDGEADATTAAATWSWIDDGTYSAVLTVNDGRGGIGQANVDVVISNVAPQVNAGDDLRIDVGQTVNFSGSFSDPGANDNPWSWTWNVAQQAYSYAGNTDDRTAPILGSHRFCRAGTYSAKLTVVDKDGDSGSDEVMITVDALPVDIDVNPTQINLNGTGHGMVTVRIFSNATVNAATLNPDQVKLTGEKGKGTSLARTGGGLWMWNADNDENGDGRPDAVAQFRRDELVQNGDLTLDSKELRLTAPIGECGDVLGKGAVSVKVNAKDKSTASALQAKP